MHRTGRHSLFTVAPPRPSTHADPGPSAAPDHRRWSSPDAFDAMFGACRGTDAAPQRTSSIEVALSRRLSDAGLAARTTRHWRGEDGLSSAAKLLVTLPVRNASHKPEDLAAPYCSFAGVKR